MRVLALDLGTKRCGVAITDQSNTIACPVKTISYKSEDYDFLAKEINSIILENKVTDLVIGKPKNMDGSEGFATKRSDELLKFINKEGINIHFEDERLTTIFAQNILHFNGKDTRQSKKVIDTLSACLILETFMKRVENARK